jgi:hypothetical protein
MSDIKSTSIVVHQFSDSNGTHWPAADANATALARLLVRCIRLTSPLTTVAYCGTKPCRCASAIAAMEVVNYWSENLPPGAGLSHPFRSQPGGRISLIAEMDWYSIRQVDLQPCSADLICRSRCKPGKWIGSVYGRLTTWSQPLRAMLRKCSNYAVTQVPLEIGRYAHGLSHLGCQSLENSPSAAGTGRMLVGLFLGPGVRVGG